MMYLEPLQLPQYLGAYVQKTACSLDWFPNKLLKNWNISFNACHIQYKVYPFGVK